jgi:myo-inositol 2-dehydrogenase/D-chiro-inositol 1-dehydrogenase
VQRFALIGAGFIGTVHARSLAAHPKVRFVLVADADPERARTLAERHGAAPASVDAVLEADVDAVLIASSTPTHAELMERAAAAGKAIFCEKPIDLDLARARKAGVAVAKAGVPCMIGFNRRFDASHRAVRDAVAAGEVGKVEIVQLTSRGPEAPPIAYVKVSGGQMRDQTVHFFDLLRWLTADEPVEVHAMGAALVDPAIGAAGDVDTSIVSLRMRSGALGQIDCSRRTAYGYDERVEVFGSGGAAESRRQRYRSVSLYQGAKVVEDGLHAGWFERVEATYHDALDAFVRHLEGETAAVELPSLDDGLKAQLIADAATESLRTGQPVRIDVDQAVGENAR